MKMFYKLFLASLICVVMLAVLKPTPAYAGGVAMQVKVHYHNADGTILENPPVEIKINWDSNSNSLEACGNDGQLIFGASDPAQGQGSPYVGASYHLYQEGGTRQAYRWSNGPNNQWSWQYEDPVGACECINRRATITINGVTKTEQFKADGQTDGGRRQGEAAVRLWRVPGPMLGARRPGSILASNRKAPRRSLRRRF